ncbi:MAG: DUF1338 family protein, partial [Spirosomataceae bacterium]
MNISTLRTVMDGLMTRYTTRVPDVKKITSAMVEKELVSSSRDIENDHVAF